MNRPGKWLATGLVLLPILTPAAAYAQVKAPVPANAADTILAAAKSAEAEGNYTAALREYRRLLEVYANEPRLQAPVYLLMSADAEKAGETANAKTFAEVSAALDPALAQRAASASGASGTRGGNGKADALLALASAALQGYAQYRAARAQAQPPQPDPSQQYAQQAQYPQAPYGQQGYQPPAQGYAPTPGYDPNATMQAQAGAYPQQQPGAYPQQPQAGYPQQPQPGYPQQQPGAYPQQAQAGYPPQQQGAYPQPPQPGAYPQQPGAYPQQQQPGAYPQQAAYPQQQQPGAYPQQQPGYPQQQPGAYPQQAQAGYPQQQPGAYPPQPGAYPQQPGDPNQQAYAAQGQAPYAASQRRDRRTRGAAAESFKVVYDRAHFGATDRFANACGALLTVDGSELVFTPGCGEAPRVIPASEIIEIRPNALVGREAGAFHIITRKGLYLDVAPPTGDRELGRTYVESLRKGLGIES